MAVNINTVYLRVLAIANKEQRGYITPQEFNTLANQAQLDIFEQYFYDLNQFLRLPGNDTIHSDAVDMLEEKIGIFEVYNSPIGAGTLSDLGVHKLGAVYHQETINGVQTKIEAEKLNPNELRYYINSPLTAPTVKRPIFIVQQDQITVLPVEADNLSMNYIAKPLDVYWGYTMINDEALYNPAASINFQLHASEETELVLKILTLAGVAIRDPQLYQIAAAEDAKNIQQEKQ
ncbi:hypothetical protein N9988_00320 [bacterium]|jgi:hypothetical protein|nr:hypothetical protein [bacterium]